MNKTRLLGCPSCSRHVRATESACPFCGGDIPSTFASLAAPKPPSRRLSRAALYAFGATSLGLATACGGSTTSPGDGDAALDHQVQGQPLYGASFDGPIPLLDAPGAEDARSDAADTGAPADASADSDLDAVDIGPLDGRAVAAYGASAPDR